MSEARSRLMLLMALSALGLLCLIGLWPVLATIGLKLPIDPNEGWNAYHAAAAISGQPLYPGPHADFVNNYPPLSFYIVGLFGRVVGDVLIAGRIISLLAFVAVCAGLAVASRRMGVGRDLSLLPPLFFAAVLLLSTDYAGMDDPQMLAHAIAMGGFLLVLRPRRDHRRLAAAALLFVLAFFVKHNVVAMPLAVTAWLFLHERKSAWRLTGFGAAFLIVGLLIFRLAYGVSLFSVVATARTYSFDALRQGLLAWLVWSAVPIIALAGLVRFRRADPFVSLCLLYTGIGTAIGLVFLGGAGVDPNVLFDADIAVALSAAVVVHRLKGWQQPALAAGIIAPLLLAAATSQDWQDHVQHPLEDAATSARDIAYIAGRRGPALCEMLSFCYWAGKPATVDVFNLGQQFATGTRSADELVRRIAAKRFAVIQFDPDSPAPLGPAVRQAMQRAYRIDHRDDLGTFYVPR